VTSGDESAENDPYIGCCLGERYQVLELLGAGGWARVYRGVHVSLGSPVAIKVMHAHLDLEAHEKRLEQEARQVSRIESPHVVRTIDYGLQPRPYIVMDYFAGVPLSAVIEKQVLTSGRFFDLVLQVCRGLEAAHKLGIIHRDLKPSNILVRMDEEGLSARVVDFGIAKVLGESSEHGKLTGTGEILGSPAYMPPEQWIGAVCDCRSDIYSLGCVMYEVLSGKPVFSGVGLDYMHKHACCKPLPFASVAPERKISSDVELIVMKCLQKSPDRRYRSIAELSADLQRLSRGERLVKLALEQKLSGKLEPAYKILVALVVLTYIAVSCYRQFWSDQSWFAYLRQGSENANSPERAAAKFHKALQLIPQDSVRLRNETLVYIEWGGMYAANGRYEDAVPYFKKALTQSERFRDTKRGGAQNYWRPLHAGALEGLTTCYMKEKKPQFAMAIDGIRQAIADREFLFKTGWDVNKGDNLMVLATDRIKLADALADSHRLKEALAEYRDIEVNLVSRIAEGRDVLPELLRKEADQMDRLGSSRSEVLPLYERALALLRQNVGEGPSVKELADLIERKKSQK
jgi:serine/threonine protein kinase